MKMMTKVRMYLGLAIGSGLMACSEKPIQQTRNTTETSVETLWQIPDDQATTKLLSAPEMEHRTQMIDYEIEKLNRLIDYHADENIDYWEGQKATLQRYKLQLQSGMKPLAQPAGK